MSRPICAFCEGPMNVNDVTCIEKCSHAFHNRCITPFFTRSSCWRKCPLCNEHIERLTQLFFSESGGPILEDIIETYKTNINMYNNQLKLQKEQLHKFALQEEVTERLQREKSALSEKIILFYNLERIINSRTRNIRDIFLSIRDLDLAKAFATFIKTEEKSSLAKEKKKTEQIEKKLEQARAAEMKVTKKLISLEAKIKGNEEKIAELQKKLDLQTVVGKPPNTAGSKSNDGKTKKITKKTRAPRI